MSFVLDNRVEKRKLSQKCDSVVVVFGASGAYTIDDTLPVLVVSPSLNVILARACSQVRHPFVLKLSEL